MVFPCLDDLARAVGTNVAPSEHLRRSSWDKSADRDGRVRANNILWEWRSIIEDPFH